MSELKKVSEFADFDRMEAIGFGDLLDGGKTLLMEIKHGESSTSAPEVGAGPSGSASRVALVDLASGKKTFVTAGGEAEGNPKASEDGTKILFLSRKDGQYQIFVYDRVKGGVRQITQMRFGASDPQWSKDGTKILFTSPASDEMDENWLQTKVDPKEEAAYQREKAKESIVITDFGYKFDGLGFAKPEVMQLFVVSAEGGRTLDGEGVVNKAKKITKGTSNFMHSLFDPDGRHVVCESNLFCNKEVSIMTDVLRIDIETCEIERVTKDRMVVSYPNPIRPVFTKDGQYLIIGILDYGDKTYTAGYPSCSLYKVSLDGKELVKLTKKTDECFDNVQFAYNAHCGKGLERVRVSSDGAWVYFHAGWKGECRVYKVRLDGQEQEPIPVLTGKYAYNGMSAPRGGEVLVTRGETDKPEAYYRLNESTGELALLYQSGQTYIDETALSRAEEITFRTLDGESTVHGFCLPPQNREPGKKYPAIVYVHGGPHPFVTYGFDLEYQCFAGAGIGVLYCNPRGSSGYGDLHRNLNRAFDGSAYTDIMQFTEEACRQFDWIDPERIGMTGGSYGGYMTNYTATRAKRFKAYITQRSVVNDLIGYASSDMQGRSKAYPTFGEFMVHQIESSTICGMEKVSAPFLILHGEDDLRCPVEGAHQLFVALKDSHPEDFPIKMILYPHVAHDQPREKRQRAHYYGAMLDWFKKYL